MKRDKSNHNKESIYLYDEITLLKTEKKKKHFIFSYIQLFLMSLFVMYGMTASFIQTFLLEVSLYKINIAIILCPIIFIVLFSLPKYKRYVIPAFLLFFLIALYEYWDVIKEGFYLLENRFILFFNNYYNMSIGLFVAVEQDQEYMLTTMIIFAIIIVSAIIVWLQLYGRANEVYLVVTIPIVFLGLIVGLMPPYLAFLLYCIGSIGILFSTSTKKQESRRNHIFKHISKVDKRDRQHEKNQIALKVGSVMMFCAAFLAIIISFIFTPSDYENKIHIEGIKHDLQSKMIALTQQTPEIIYFGPSKASGGVSGGKLGRASEVSFENDTALTIILPNMEETVYLRGYVGESYQQSNWEKFSNKKIEKIAADFGLSGNLDSLSMNEEIFVSYMPEEMSVSVYNMEVSNISANTKYTYSPYQVMSSQVSEENKNTIRFEYFDNYFLRDSFASSSADSYRPILSTLFQEHINSRQSFELFEQYQEFLHQVYTSLPDKGAEQAQMVFAEELTYDPSIPLEVYVDMIRDYLYQNTRYSLSPGSLPKGEDFVDYFLFESQEGYCSHYASAAVILLRSVGIPARYVEGYVVTRNDFVEGKILANLDWETQKPIEIDGLVYRRDRYETVEVDIKDTNAHAWAEVYIDYFGWIPLEFTPDYIGMDGSIVLPDEIVESLENKEITKPEAEEIPPSLEEQEIKDSKKIEDKKIEDKEKTESVFNMDQNKIIELPNKQNLLLRIITVTILLFFILLVYVLARYCYFFYKAKALSTQNKNLQAIYTYHKLMRLLSFYKIKSYKNENYLEYVSSVERSLEYIQKNEFLQVFELILKAQYGKNEITDTEYEKINLLYNRIKEEIYQTVGKKKSWFYEFIKCY